MRGTGQDVEGVYRETAARHSAARDRQARLSARVAWTRLAVFLGAAACILSAFSGPEEGAALRIGGGAAGILVFFGLVAWHSRIEARERWFASLANVNVEAAERVARHWDRLTPAAEPGPGPEHEYAGDLDVFGRASLAQLLGGVGTASGRRTLAAWLASPAAPDTIRARQAAVAELAPRAGFREEFAALGRLMEPAGRDLQEFIDWAEGGPWLSRHRWLPWTARLVSVLVVSLFAAQVVGLVAGPLWLYPLVPSAALFALLGKRIVRTFNRVFSRTRQLQEHAALFARVADARFASSCLRRIQGELQQTGLTATREMRTLSLISQFADLRFVTIFHPAIMLLTLWDIHVLVELERWQARNARHLRRWFAALGEFDALAALAVLAHDNPDWVFPEVVEHASRIEATDLGHPLIASGRRVANDVLVGPPGSLLLVTGSNMSGKSTLLRAIGVNAVLAQAGGPVCAAMMTLPPLSLCTSMRVQDSLEDGVSYFMAALARVKLVVSAARSVRPDGPMLLYLLDEVLAGTNTAERQVAVRRILKHLLDLRVIGAVTTHDLELAECEELSAACQPVHFTEGVEEGGDGARLTFDYVLRPGVATSRNALKLVRMAGLDV